MKPLRVLVTICLACVALLLLIELGLSRTAANPVDAAKAVMSAKGMRPEDLSLLSWQSSNGLFGGTAQVEFDLRAADDRKHIHLDLVRSAFSRQWRVSADDESGATGP